MREIESDIRQLLEKTERTRVQFLQVELQTCLTALDMAKHELEIGHIEVAARELLALKKGIATMHRFIPEMREDARRAELEWRLVELEAACQPFEQALQAHRHGG